MVRARRESEDSTGLITWLWAPFYAPMESCKFPGSLAISWGVEVWKGMTLKHWTMAKETKLLKTVEVLQPEHYWNFGLDNSLLWRDILHVVECVGESLTSTHERPVAPFPFPSCGNQQSLQTLSDTPWGAKSLQMRTTRLENVIFLIGKFSSQKFYILCVYVCMCVHAFVCGCVWVTGRRGTY